MAPLAVRKSAYINVGGMDETMSEPGDCGTSAVTPACMHACIELHDIGHKFDITA